MGQVAALPMSSAAAAVAGAIQWAYQQIKGVAPPAQTSWLWPLALSANETASWRMPSGTSGGLYNWNIGNVTTTGSASVSYYLNPAVTANLKFVSYPDLGSGALGMMQTLSADGGLAAADAGDMSAWQTAQQSYQGCTFGTPTPTCPSLQSLITSLAGTVPTPYSPPGTSSSAIASLASLPWPAIAGAAGILAVGGAAMWVLLSPASKVPAPLRRFALQNPVGREDSDPESMVVQSLLFPRPRWDVHTARKWASRHGYYDRDVDVTPRYIHLVQMPTKGFAVIRTIPLGRSGVKAHVAREV